MPAALAMIHYAVNAVDRYGMALTIDAAAQVGHLDAIAVLARVAGAWTRHHLARLLAARDERSDEAAALRREADATAAELGLVRLQQAAGAA